MKVVACIPSRYQSSRLPGKPLLDIGGKPMILHVLERASRAKSLQDLIVLTDDERIYQTVTEFGYRAAMTSADCQSGTERIIDFLSQTNAEAFINIQGDELLIDPQQIDDLIDAFIKDDQAQMATLAHYESNPAILHSPTTAKIVTDQQHNALYFSRSCIPLQQDGRLPDKALVQIGVYAYTRKTLEKLATLPVSPLEAIEKLEQLRALQAGIRVKIVLTQSSQSLSIDTPEDLAKARALYSQ